MSPAGAEVISKGRKWTVMVFMGANTVAGNAPMFDAAEADLKELEQVGSGDSLDIFVQIHGKGIPQRGHIGVDQPGVGQLNDVPDPLREPARGWALFNFLAWAIGESNRRQPEYAEHCSMLVLWGHAYEFAIGHAPTRHGTIDALDFAELSTVLEKLQTRFGGAAGSGSPLKLDILGFDACDLATVEMACQLQPFADYLVGSQIGIPIPGWPYDDILDRLRKPTDKRVMSPAEFGSFLVRRYCAAYTSLRTVSLSLLDLARVPELFAHAEVLALMLATEVGRDAATRDRIRYLFSQSQTAEDRPYVDAAALCLNLLRYSGEPLLMEAARALGDFLISPQTKLVNGLEVLERPFIIENGRNATETAGLNGISLYAPHVAPFNDFEAVRDLYENFEFAKETQWSGLVHTLASLT